MQSLPSSNIGAKRVQVPEMQSPGNPAEGGRRFLCPGIRHVHSNGSYAPCTGLTLSDWPLDYLSPLEMEDLAERIGALAPRAKAQRDFKIEVGG